MMRNGRNGTTVARLVARCAAALLVAAASVAATAPALALAKTVAPFATNGAQEAMLWDNTLHPAAVRSGSVTYLAYQGPGFDPYIASYDASTGAWTGPYRIGTNLLALDAHGAPAIYVDPGGYVHALFGGHNTPLKHARGIAPGRIDAWQGRTDVAPVATYPQIATFTPGSAPLLIFRGGDGEWYETRASDAAMSGFGTPKKLLANDASTWWYAHSRGMPDGTVHLAFSRLDRAQYDAGKVFVRYDVFHMVRGVDGTWRTIAGVPVSLPVDTAIASAPSMVALDTGTRIVNGLSLRLDADGRPAILAIVGNGAGPGAYRWELGRWNGASWAWHTITTTDHYFDAGAMRVRADGSFEAFVTSGVSDARGAGDNVYRGRGGRIERWTSADASTWSGPTVVSPDEGPVLFSDPVLVEGAGDDGPRLAYMDWTDDESDALRRLYLSDGSHDVSRTVTGAATRLAGADAVGTSLAVSRAAFPERSFAVVIATDRDFPDALAGAPLANALRGPLILTRPGGLSAATKAEIARLKPARAMVLGTSDVVSEQVVRDLRAASPKAIVERVGGATRFDTMLAVARRMKAIEPARPVGTAVLVSGWNWPDAAAAAPLAAANGWPILLADGDRPRWQVENALRENGVGRVVVAGGTDVVGPSVIAHLATMGSAAPTETVRLEGPDRYGTAAAVAAWGLDRHGLVADRALLASGGSYADALSAATLGARGRAPLYLVKPGELSTPTQAALEAASPRITQLWGIGGTGVLTPSVWTMARSTADVP